MGDRVLTSTEASCTHDFDDDPQLQAKRIEAESLRHDRARLREALDSGLGSPWPPRDVVAKLVGAVDHLLKDHACDAHGYESVMQARDAATTWLIKGNPIAPAPEPKTSTCADCGATRGVPPETFVCRRCLGTKALALAADRKEERDG